VPGAPNQGYTAREQFRLGAQKLVEMTLRISRRAIRDELEPHARSGRIFQRHADIEASPSTRWPHGLRLCGEFASTHPDDYEERV